MRSFWMQVTDTSTQLKLRDVPVPTPGPGQLLARLHAAALNRDEVLPNHGTQGQPETWKAIGDEGAG